MLVYIGSASGDSTWQLSSWGSSLPLARTLPLASLGRVQGSVQALPEQVLVVVGRLVLAHLALAAAAAVPEPPAHVLHLNLRIPINNPSHIRALKLNIQGFKKCGGHVFLC